MTGMNLKKLAGMLKVSVERNTQYIEPRIMFISIIATIGFPLYYVIWHFTFPQPYENLGLRLLGSALFTPLILVKYWPQWLIRHKSTYWYLSSLYGLPFFFTFMLLKNGGNTVWLLSTLIAIFLMIILLDWLNLLIQFCLGVSLAWLAYYTTTDTSQMDLTILPQVPIYLFAIIIGIAANYSGERVRQERLVAMLATASNIAHELRTPLLGIKSGAAGLRIFLPYLIEAYQLAREHGLAVEPIRLVHLHTMRGVLERIESEADYSNTIIDMLLMNTSINGFTTTNLTVCSIAQCVEAALNRYPFASENEKQLLVYNKEMDFNFRGIELLMVHVLFNLIKNSLYHIAKARKGSISIQLKKSPQSNMLIFRDTGTGVPPEVLPHIFTRFYSWSPGKDKSLGTGIGLAFCRSVMDSFGGSISCKSQLGEYTEFVVIFPSKESL
jgi:two-component system CAI-1 autoinducer sensor kinase/phosphatase CqsS